MTKQKKLEYIEAINERFINARNHGHQGNNWWYPKENRIAYNVKIYSGVSLTDIRKSMTKRQNDYYSDDQLYEIVNHKQVDDANMYAEDIKTEFKGVTETGYAGQSCGWLEVDYENSINFYNDPPTIDEINENYQIAKELEKNENAVAVYIAESVKNYKKYLESKEAINDIVEFLQSDDDIADNYKGRIKTLTDKLN